MIQDFTDVDLKGRKITADAPGLSDGLALGSDGCKDLFELKK